MVTSRDRSTVYEEYSSPCFFVHCGVQQIVMYKSMRSEHSSPLWSNISSLKSLKRFISFTVFLEDA